MNESAVSYGKELSLGYGFSDDGVYVLQNLQVPVAPLQVGNGPTPFSEAWQNEIHGAVDNPPEQGVPTIITWSFGGNNVAVEGSWDNWASRLFLITPRLS